MFIEEYLMFCFQSHFIGILLFSTDSGINHNSVWDLSCHVMFYLHSLHPLATGRSHSNFELGKKDSLW